MMLLITLLHMQQRIHRCVAGRCFAATPKTRQKSMLSFCAWALFFYLWSFFALSAHSRDIFFFLLLRRALRIIAGRIWICVTNMEIHHFSDSVAAAGAAHIIICFAMSISVYIRSIDARSTNERPCVFRGASTRHVDIEENEDNNIGSIH